MQCPKNILRRQNLFYKIIKIISTIIIYRENIDGEIHMKIIKNIKALYIILLTAALFLLFCSGCAHDSSLKPIDEANINTCQITISGISREYHLLFLTDTHIILSETGDSQEITQEIKNYSAQRLSQFTGASGIVSSDLFLSWVSYANRNELDALLLGGDIIDSPSPANIAYLGDSLEKLEIPYIYTLGNHDWTYPWEYMTQKGVDAYLPLLSPYMGGSNASESSFFENNFFGNAFSGNASSYNTAIHTLEFDDFIIVAVDDSSNQINPDALEKYKEILKNGKPIILLLHVPLYTESLSAKTSSVWRQSVLLGGGIHGETYPNEVSTEFLQLTTAKNSPVAAVIAGHVHFSSISNIKGEKEIPQITGDAGFKGKGMIIHILPPNE